MSRLTILGRVGVVALMGMIFMSGSVLKESPQARPFRIKTIAIHPPLIAGPRILPEIQLIVTTGLEGEINADNPALFLLLSEEFILKPSISD